MFGIGARLTAAPHPCKLAGLASISGTPRSKRGVEMTVMSSTQVHPVATPLH